MRYPRAGCKGGREVTHSSRDVNPLLMGGTRVGVTNTGEGPFPGFRRDPRVAMRRGRGGDKSFIGAVALCATVACSGGPRLQPEPVVATACALTDTLRMVADTATITVSALGMTREQCALTIVAATLRPWPAASSG